MRAEQTVAAIAVARFFVDIQQVSRVEQWELEVNSDAVFRFP